MKKTHFFISFFALFFCTMLIAQSADKVTNLIEAKEVTLEEVAYFASTYLELTNEDVEDEYALEALKEKVQLDRISQNTTALTYADFAYFCTQVWDIDGGIMLSLTKAPRYAFRELQYKGYISSTKLPQENITGLEALTIITQCIDYSIENETKEAEATNETPSTDFQSTFSR